MFAHTLTLPARKELAAMTMLQRHDLWDRLSLRTSQALDPRGYPDIYMKRQLWDQMLPEDRRVLQGYENPKAADMEANDFVDV